MTKPSSDNVAGEQPAEASLSGAPMYDGVAPSELSSADAQSTQICPTCRLPDGADAAPCDQCGNLTSATDAIGAPAEHGVVPELGALIGGRYQIGELIGRRGRMLRFRGLDLGSGRSTPLPIMILCEPASSEIDPKDVLQDLFRTEPPDLSVVAPNNDPESLLADTKIDEPPKWPSIAWEKRLLARTPHLSIPRVLDFFRETPFDYLIEEVPIGQSFWDVWDESPTSWPRRCEWLIQIAEALDQLHAAGAILEWLRPESILVTPTSQAVLADLTCVLPYPAPADFAVRDSLYTAPELIYGLARASARADLYTFGAMVHALLLGRELTDLDFTAEGLPKPYLERFPDAHPSLGRLLARTFVREIDCRFPSHDRFAMDPTGFEELIDVLKLCSRTLDSIRLDVAAWTSTGAVRSENEDAVAVLHSAEVRLEDSDDFAVVVLADGMGGMASGELAAALTIQTVRDFFLRHAPFTDLRLTKSTNDPPQEPPAPHDPRAILSAPVDFDALVLEALKEANCAVFEEARKDNKHRGMGCTAEVLLVDGKQVFIGHVGDSRTYLLRHGRLSQVTRDQTLVSQLVALGQLTEAEAELHPQRSELQQAIGGRRDVYPDQYFLTLEEGDWLLVCSDGVSNQLKGPEIVSVMQSAGSAEKAARRLVNHAILAGAFDNVSVVVIRAC
jgi:serine/threonine protein phosphatase PrpC